MRTFTFLFAVCFSIHSYAQSFSGTVVYSVEYKAKSDDFDIEALRANRSSEIRYSIMDGYYKSVQKKRDEVYYSYVLEPVTGKIYDIYEDKTVVTFRDSEKYKPKRFYYTVFDDSTFTINGYKCYKVKFDTDYGTTTSYFSDSLRVDPSTFKTHILGHWIKKLKITNGGIPLKSVTEYKDYIRIQEAVEIIPEAFTTDDFVIPNDKPIIASLQALDVNVKHIYDTDILYECLQFYAKAADVDIDDIKGERIMVELIVNEEGNIEDVNPLIFDWKRSNLVKKIVKECGFKFKPGKIKRKKVAALVRLPLQF